MRIRLSLLALASAATMAVPAYAGAPSKRAKDAAVHEAEHRTARTAADSDELVVLARFVRSSPSAGCGYFKVTTVEHHSVVRVVSGHHPGGDIFVAVTCHEFYANVRAEGGGVVPRWRGQVFRLRLQRGEPQGEMIHDAFQGISSVRYRLVDPPVWVPSGI